MIAVIGTLGGVIITVVASLLTASLTARDQRALAGIQAQREQHKVELADRRTDCAAVYDSFAAGDVDAVFTAMTPDIEWDESEGMPYGGVYHGREAIVSNVFGPILADVEGFTAAPEEILALDESRVVALGRHDGRCANGPVHTRFVHIWTVTNGLVSRYRQLADTHTLRTAIGK